MCLRPDDVTPAFRLQKGTLYHLKEVVMGLVFVGSSVEEVGMPVHSAHP
jgi:hypothetical protein